MNDLNTQIAEVLGWDKGAFYQPDWQADMNDCIRDLIPVLRGKFFGGVEFGFITIEAFTICNIWTIKKAGGNRRCHNVKVDGPPETAIPESFCKAWLEAIN